MCEEREEQVAEGGAEIYFTAAELEEIRRIAKEPFVAADPEAVRALFAKHGL